MIAAEKKKTNEETNKQTRKSFGTGTFSKEEEEVLLAAALF